MDSLEIEQEREEIQYDFFKYFLVGLTLTFVGLFEISLKACENCRFMSINFFDNVSS